MPDVSDPKLKRARKAFTEFSGHRPNKVVKRQLDDKEVTGYRLGSLLGVAYEARRDGKTDRYFHEFGKKARPDLVVKDDGSQLYISGGNYAVTDHGIEDMPALFVVNPSPRRKKAAKATSKKRKSTTMARRRRTSTVRRRRVTRRSVTTFKANPIRRRRRSRRTAVAVGTRRRSYRRNPIVGVRRRRRSGGGGRGFPKITALIMPAVGIGAGAVLSEVVIGYLPIPANFKTGPARHLTKGVVSLALGMAVAKFANKKAGELMALGGLTIAVHDSIKELVLRYAPSTKFGGYGYYNPAQVTNGMGMYLNTSPGGLGEYMPPQYGFAGNSGGETEFQV